MNGRNSLDEAFARARIDGRGVLIPYLTAGYPEPDHFVDLAIAILAAGADALEIGIPFSDPLLDGPAIQRSQKQALDAGVTPHDCLRYTAQIRERSGDKPLLFMGAYNPILAYGPDRFCREARASGIAAVIAPDLPFEEQDELSSAAEANDLHLIQLVAPTSTPDRLRRVCAAASGFIYCVSVTGVTGERSSVVHSARPLVDAVRGYTDVPVAVGFGISGPEQARQVATFADGVIVGAALINLIAGAPRDQRLQAVHEFVADLRNALEASALASER